MPTDTATKLEGMTNRADFEVLALQILRREPKCAAIIRAGTNSKGETIVSPVDGFCRVPGSSPPHFVMFESTTTDAEGLARKWLFDHQKVPPPSRTKRRKPKRLRDESDDGDLVKAARESKKLLAAHPTAKFTVVLATNQVVKRELHDNVVAAAAVLGVDCDIWEQSRIADALDTTSTGHYLRWYYLRTAAERLSSDLLMQVARQNLEAYAGYARIPGPARWIPRDVERRASNALSDAAASVVLLVGESGFGKTVAAYRVMESWLKRGGYALWLSETIIEQAVSAENAIDLVLRDRVPSLIESSVRVLPEILAGQRLLVVVDDLNRASRPQELLRKVTAWAAGAGAAPKSSGPFLFFCPLWPRVRDGSDARSQPHVRQLSVGMMSPSEACDALGRETNRCEELAEDLAFDPFAIALYNETRATGVQQGRVTAREILTQFIGRCIDAVQGAPGSVCTSGEHWDAVECMAEESVSAKLLAPPLSAVRGWLASDRRINAFGELLKHSGVLWEDASAVNLQYRHDRIRDRVLSYGMKRVALGGRNTELLVDPFFAEIVASALVDLGVEAALVELLSKRAPLVLALALPIVHAGSNEEQRLEGGLRAWALATRNTHSQVAVQFRFAGAAPDVSSIHVAGSFNGWPSTIEAGGFSLKRVEGTSDWSGTFWVPPGRHLYKFVVNEDRWSESRTARDREADGFGGFNSVFEVGLAQATSLTAFKDVHSRLVFRALARMDTPVILSLVDVLPSDDIDVLLARFRNGDAVAGIQFFGSHAGEPTVSYTDRDEAVAAVQRYHAASVVDAISSLIPTFEEDRHRTGAIILCGFLATPDALRLAMECWRSATSRNSLLAACLWAQLSANGAPDEASIHELLGAYASLSDEEGGALMSQRTAVHEYLRLGKPMMSPEMLAVLRDRTMRERTLRSLAWTLFRGVDHPTAVEVMSRLGAELEEQVKAEGGVPFGLMTFTDEWTRGSRRMSIAATAHLRELWTRESEPALVRKYAFRLWLAGDAWDLNELAGVPIDGSFGDDVIWARAKRADQSCASLVAERFAKSTRWANVAAQVWTDAIRRVTEAYMQNLAKPLSDRAHDVAQLLMRAPEQDARALMEAHWERIRRNPYFIHAAIAIGGDRLQELVKEAIQTWPEGEGSPFKHLTMHLHIHFEDEARFVDQKVIERLLPYIPSLEEFDVVRIGEACRRRGFASWGRAHVAPLMSESARRRVFPTEEDLMRELDDAVARNRDRPVFPGGHVWAERARERVDEAIDLVKVIDVWLERSSVPRRLGVAADALIELGERRGIEVLSRRVDANHAQQQEVLNRATTLIRRRSLT